MGKLPLGKLLLGKMYIWEVVAFPSWGSFGISPKGLEFSQDFGVATKVLEANCENLFVHI